LRGVVQKMKNSLVDSGIIMMYIYNDILSILSLYRWKSFAPSDWQGQKVCQKIIVWSKTSVFSWEKPARQFLESSLLWVKLAEHVGFTVEQAVIWLQRTSGTCWD
jgi:nitrate reductase gamma subunit